MRANKNKIVVYQLNETVRLDVWSENETGWLTQERKEYGNEHGYHLMITRTIDGKRSFTSDFSRPSGEFIHSFERCEGE